MNLFVDSIVLVLDTIPCLTRGASGRANVTEALYLGGPIVHINNLGMLREIRLLPQFMNKNEAAFKSTGSSKTVNLIRVVDSLRKH